MSARNFLAIVLTLTPWLCWPGAAAGDQPIPSNIHPDLKQFLAEANAEGKILLVDFSGDWCPWCVKMDQTVADPHVHALLEEKFHYVKLDIGNFDKHVECLKQYGIRGIPHLIAFDADGNVLKTQGGYAAPADFATTLQKITLSKRKVIKDAAEYNAYITALNTADPERKADAMEAFVERYPNSIVKTDALEQAMAGYQQAGNQSKLADAAGRILQANPDHVRALAVVVALKRASGTPKAIAEAGDVAVHGLKVLPDWTKPDGMTDEQYGSLRDQMAAIFNGAAGLQALQLRKYADARDFYLKALAARGDNMQDTYQLSVAQLQMEPLDPTGFWYAAKAIALAQGNTAAQEAMSKYAKAKYRAYHGGEDGWNALIGLAVQQSAPVADFAQSIKRGPSPAEVAVQAVRDNDPASMSFSDWEFVLSYRDASPENRQAAEKIWQTIQNKQKGGSARLSLPAKVISADGGVIKVAVTDENQRANKPDMAVTLSDPTVSPPPAGSRITVVGVIADYSPSPFMLTMNNAEFNLIEKSADLRHPNGAGD